MFDHDPQSPFSSFGIGVGGGSVPSGRLVAAPNTVRAEPADEVAARLMRGHGTAVAAARDYGAFGDLGPVVHGGMTTSNGAVEFVLVASPPADSAWRTLPVGGCTAAVAMIEEIAPVPDMKVNLSHLRTWGHFVRMDPAADAVFTDQAGMALETFLDPLLFRVMPDRVSVHGQSGEADVAWGDVLTADVDPVAHYQAALIPMLENEVGHLWRRVCASTRAHWPSMRLDNLDPHRDPRCVCVDGYGVTLVAFSPDTAMPVRVPFEWRARTYADVLHEVTALSLPPVPDALLPGGVLPTDRRGKH